MKSTESAATESRKRNRGVGIHDIQEFLETKLIDVDYRIAYIKVKNMFLNLEKLARQTIPSVKSQYLYYW